MNYSWYGIEKKEDELVSSSRKIEKRVGLWIVRALLFVCLSLIVAALGLAAGMWRSIADGAPDIDTITISPGGYATFIYDSDGVELQKLTSSDSNRTAVSLDRVPDSLKNAVISAEDERFYLHKGVDPKGLIRAAVYAAMHSFRLSQGASTITQQLLKNNVFTNWTEEKTTLDRIKRKIQEQYLALELEKKLQNKDLILENYLNTINLGAGTYGVQAASRKYFNKNVWDLTLSESTVIAGITQNPSRYNPIRHPEENAGRRSRILNKMVELGYITEEEKQAALDDDVYTRIADAQTVHEARNTVYSYFVDELTAQVVKDLMSQKGYTEVQAYQLLYSGGLRIYTTQDQAIQTICDEEFNNPANFPEGVQYYLDFALTVRHEDGSTDNYSREMMRNYFRTRESSANEGKSFDLLFDSEAEAQHYVDLYRNAVMKEGDEIVSERTEFVPQPQSSLVVMDQRTGYVKAIVGGRGAKTASLTLNRATATYRQPGSTFKILSTYAAALDSGAKTIGSYVEDAPYQYENGTDVHNAGGEYRGWITLRQAVTDSVNVAAVKTLTQITPARGYQQLLKFGFTSLDPAKDIVQPLALGGISKGVSNLQLTAAYAALANGGIYTKPIFYTKILDQNGQVVIDNTPETRRAVSADTAWILTDAMEDVVKEGTAAAVQLESGMPVAGKTGTTSNYNDLWFVGYTPYYTMGIWAGFDNNEEMPEEGTYREYHKTLWKAIMSRLTADKAITSFAKPDTVQKVTTCGLTNLLPTTACEHQSSDYVSAAYMPAAVCRLCGEGHAEAYDDDDWQAYTEDVITENNYEEIPEEDFELFFDEDEQTDADATGAADFDIYTEDEGTYFDDEEDEIEWLDEAYDEAYDEDGDDIFQLFDDESEE